MYLYVDFRDCHIIFLLLSFGLRCRQQWVRYLIFIRSWIWSIRVGMVLHHFLTALQIFEVFWCNVTPSFNYLSKSKLYWSNMVQILQNQEFQSITWTLLWLVLEDTENSSILWAMAYLRFYSSFPFIYYLHHNFSYYLREHKLIPMKFLIETTILNFCTLENWFSLSCFTSFVIVLFSMIVEI